ncbi:MAG: 4-phosphoerythronate dehydrogenase [Bacteroidetes bacterium]|nr:4-phosphoerythronate dehydrogenase [Bacteroidota bacterium]
MPIIVVNKHTPAVVEAFAHIGTVIPLDTLEVTPDAVRNADALIVRSETKVDAHLLEGSSVRFVGTVTIGTDHVDEAYLASRGITFVSAPGSNSNSVAEYVAAALLTWSARTGEPLENKILGIVGVGNVGSKVARVGHTLGMTVILNDPPLARATGDTKYRPIEELYDADFITLHVPLTKDGPDATYHLFAKEKLLAMKKGAVLINTSRGPVVDTNALIEVLRNGHLSTAILDVWEGEPVINTELLRAVMIGTPHIAGYSLDGKLNACRMVYEAACKFFNVQPQWSIDSSMPEEDARIQIPHTVVDRHAIVRAAVKQGYDIELDDTLLRKVLTMEVSLQKAYFMKLRAEYRIRREFFNRCVVLHESQRSARPILEGLGFRVVQGE